MMGLSPGWGDKYGQALVGQYIDITGLSPGKYRLIGTADADDWFLESDNTNNSTWVDIRLTATDKVRILRTDPARHSTQRRRADQRACHFCRPES